MRIKFRLHYVIRQRVVVFVVMIGVAIVGILLLWKISAATAVIVLEPEMGTIDRASIVPDATASGGKAVQFGADTAPSSSSRPPSGGYFQLVGTGKFSSLPNDAAAAAMVHQSTWEPRPENNVANYTSPIQPVPRPGYTGMTNYTEVFGRVTGNYQGTTDEIIQWTAAKWGLSDEIIRAEMVSESNWYQNHKSNGLPVDGEGYGDFGNCNGSPSASGYGVAGPASFGISQIKYCAHPNTWPNSERSTAYNLDYYGAVMRGCYEGWDDWLGNGYQAGDIWGCVGRWYAGDWYSADANTYISGVKSHLSDKPWLSW